MPLDTLALNPETWDLTTDAYGNWATVGDATGGASSPTGPAMRMAQDVATQCLSWAGEVYYDRSAGIMYPQLLGGEPNLPLLNAAYAQEALSVPLVAQAVANFTFQGGRSRLLGGAILTTDVNGVTGQVSL